MFSRLADELGLSPRYEQIPKLPIGQSEFSLPYDAQTGLRSETTRMALDLSKGSFVKVVDDMALADSRITFQVLGWDKHGNVQLGSKRPGKLFRRACLGRWWLAAGSRGAVERFPLVPA